jgi:hypothetical protein
MKSYLNNLTLVLMLFLAAAPVVMQAQEEEKEAPLLLVSLRYFNKDNKIPYLLINTKAKIDGKFQPVPNTAIKLYIDSSSDEKNFMGRFVTDEKGNAKAILPVHIQRAWNAAEKHSFIATSEASKQYEETEGTLDITKSRMSIDTISDGETRSVVVTVTSLEGGKWVPAKEVEMKIGVQRLGGILGVNDEATFTTDSSGQVTAEFAKLKLPGDNKGDLILVAQVEDNETIGNISASMSAPWGVPAVHEKNFFKRSLWGTNHRTPIWLLLMAYSIIGTVWGVLIFLVFQLSKIKRLGRKESENVKPKSGLRSHQPDEVAPATCSIRMAEPGL